MELKLQGNYMTVSFYYCAQRRSYSIFSHHYVYSTAFHNVSCSKQKHFITIKNPAWKPNTLAFSIVKIFYTLQSHQTVWNSQMMCISFRMIVYSQKLIQLLLNTAVLFLTVRQSPCQTYACIITCGNVITHSMP